MAITITQRNQIIHGLRDGKKQYEIARDIGITKSAVQHYAKLLRSESKLKDPDKYFNVDIYTKTVSTI